MAVRIPKIIGNQQIGTLNIARPSDNALGAVAAELEAAGESLIKVEKVIQDQQDRIDLAKLQGEYEAGMTDLKFTISQNPDYGQHTTLLTEGVINLQSDLLQKAKVRAPVSRAFQQYIGGSLPIEFVAVKANAVRLQNEQAVTDLDLMADTFADQMSLTVDPKKRIETSNTYVTLVNNAVQKGMLNQKDADIKLQKFRELTAEKTMSVLGRTDPTEMRKQHQAGAFSAIEPLKQIKILEGVRREEAAVDARARQQLERDKAEENRKVTSLAVFGELPDSFFEEAGRNRNPLISPQRAKELKAINDDPPLGGGGEEYGSDIIMGEYFSRARSIETIVKARKELNFLEITTRAGMKKRDKYLAMLQSHQEGREAVGLAGQDRTVREIKSMVGAATEKEFVSFLDIINTNRGKAIILDAQYRIYVRGEDPTTVRADVMKQLEAFKTEAGPHGKVGDLR